ncbi:MAG: glycosyltransferase family 4 protein [Actinomycetota bacterium]
MNYEYPPLGGGGGIITRTLARELAKRHDVTVLTSAGPDTAEDSYDSHARVVRVPVVGRRDLSKASLASMLSFVPAARRRAGRLIRGRRFDLVHSFFAVPTGPAGAWIARRAKAPHVLTVIGADIFDPSRVGPDRFPPLRAAVRSVVRGASAVTAISSDIANRARELTEREDITVVACGIEQPPLPQQDRASLGWGDGDFAVVTLARLVRRKQIASLARAASSVPRMRLEIIGDGPERESIEAVADPDRVRLAGPLPDAAVATRLASADAFALVSSHEGFGLVYLEAMRAGLPVIAGDVGGQTDFLHDNENALLVPPDDEERLVKALTALSSDATMRARLGENARVTAGRYTSEAMAAAYEDVYRRVRRSEERVS